MPEPTPPEKPKRIPRIAITQPTDATESVTLKVAKEHERRPCDQCGATYVQRRSHMRYCSTGCQRKAKYDRNREYISARNALAYEARKELNENPVIPCVVCGALFERKSNRQLCCSHPCSMSRNRSLILAAKHERTKAAQGLGFDCAECGKSSPYVTGREKYCSALCRDRVKYRTYRARVKDRAISAAKQEAMR